MGVDYGPSSPGTYHASFTSGSSLSAPFSYTLAKPASGMHRSYRLLLTRFDQQLQRCLVSAVESTALKYDDVPAGSSSSSSGGTTVGGPIYARFLVDSGCNISNISASGIGTINRGATYGPLPAGSGEGSFLWTFDGGGSKTYDFQYILKSPSSGTKRTYSITLVTYDNNLNRCIYAASSWPYTDTPL